MCVPLRSPSLHPNKNWPHLAESHPLLPCIPTSLRKLGYPLDHVRQSEKGRVLVGPPICGVIQCSTVSSLNLLRTTSINLRSMANSSPQPIVVSSPSQSWFQHVPSPCLCVCVRSLVDILREVRRSALVTVTCPAPPASVRVRGGHHRRKAVTHFCPGNAASFICPLLLLRHAHACAVGGAGAAVGDRVASPSPPIKVCVTR